MDCKLTSMLLLVTVVLFSGSLVNGQTTESTIDPNELMFTYRLCNGEEMYITCPAGFATEIAAAGLTFAGVSELPVCQRSLSFCIIPLVSAEYRFEDHSPLINQLRSDIYQACHNKTNCYYKTPNNTAVIYTTDMNEEHEGELDGGLCGSYEHDHLVQVGFKILCTEVSLIYEIDYKWPRPSTVVQTNASTITPVPTTTQTVTTTASTTTIVKSETTVNTSLIESDTEDPISPPIVLGPSVDASGSINHGTVYVTIISIAMTLLS